MAPYRNKSFHYWHHRYSLQNSISHYFHSRKNFPNNQSGLENATFIAQIVKELLETSRIKKTMAPPYIVNPLTFAASSQSKQTLILDLKCINVFVYQEKLKFGDWRIISEVMGNERFLINPKKTGGGSIFQPLCGFFKNVSSKGRVKPCFFVTFNIIISHIFSENFIAIHQVVRRCEDLLCQH